MTEKKPYPSPRRSPEPPNTPPERGSERNPRQPARRRYRDSGPTRAWPKKSSTTDPPKKE